MIKKRIVIVTTEAQAIAAEESANAAGFYWISSSETGIAPGKWRLKFIPAITFSRNSAQMPKRPAIGV